MYEQEISTVYIPESPMQFNQQGLTLIYTTSHTMSKFKRNQIILQTFCYGFAALALKSLYMTQYMWAFIWSIPILMMRPVIRNSKDNMESIIKELYLNRDGRSIQAKTLDDKNKYMKIKDFRRPTPKEYTIFLNSAGPAAQVLLSQYIPIMLQSKDGKPLTFLFFNKDGAVEGNHELFKSIIFGIDIQTEDYIQDEFRNTQATEVKDDLKN
ncbi:UNKNOWN [Stylonychia lemnae]|uniref:Transmembrane protein n=1 Tax=Stylonychia lemnae TaxID=5949 RepID=A0A077ZTJ8_STYLE|nr:UNKNOWN [Stylonychia lemnae]|eukprot:CDW71786.1 UNKNOWN [Stylonychia lemnae]